MADKVLRPHSEETMRRMARTSVALVLQDTTELDYSAKKGKLKDAGPINLEQIRSRHPCGRTITRVS